MMFKEQLILSDKDLMFRIYFYSKLSLIYLCKKYFKWIKKLKIIIQIYEHN